MTDTPIYDQLHIELSASIRTPQLEGVSDSVPIARNHGDNRQPISVWTLVNAHRQQD